MQEDRNTLIAGEMLALTVAALCVAFLFFHTMNLSIGVLCLACLLLAIYLATVRNGLKP